MRIARLTSCGHVAQVLIEHLLPIPAEIEAERQAAQAPGTFFAVIPDDAEDVFSIAFRSPVWRSATVLPA